MIFLIDMELMLPTAQAIFLCSLPICFGGLLVYLVSRLNRNKKMKQRKAAHFDKTRSTGQNNYQVIVREGKNVGVKFNSVLYRIDFEKY